MLVLNVGLGLGADLLSGIVQGGDGHNGAGRHRGMTCRCALRRSWEVVERERLARAQARSELGMYKKGALLSRFCLVADY